MVSGWNADVDIRERGSKPACASLVRSLAPSSSCRLRADARKRTLGTSSMALLVVIVILAALTVHVIISNRRHRRLRSRIERLHRRDGEHLQLLKPLYVLRAESILENTRRSPRMPVEFRSECGEDILLFTLLVDTGSDPNLSGFFIEAGGYDGYTFAATYALEALGWTGLVVEPIPELHRACCERRPGSRVVRAALSRRGSTGTARFVHVGDSVSRHDVSSHLLGERPAKAPASSAARQVIDVPITTVDDLLAAHDGIVDAAVIDVEGAELDLLDGFDLDRFRPRVLIVEDHGGSQGVIVVRTLQARGYEQAGWLAHNRIFVRRDEPALLARAHGLFQHTGTRR